MSNTLAVIPARGGSKSIPRKNLVLLGGKPLIVWSIEAARGARVRVVVSTDDEEIAGLSRRAGAEVPFLRPAELARDDSRAEDAILHALEWFRTNQGWQPEIVMCLQPTSPLRTTEDIDAALALLEERAADSVVSVTPADPHPCWTMTLDKRGWLEPFVKGSRATRRQDLPPVFALNGAIYVARIDSFLRNAAWYGGRTAAYVMPADRSVDIDTPWDLRLAEFAFRGRS